MYVALVLLYGWMWTTAFSQAASAMPPPLAFVRPGHHELAPDSGLE